MSNKSVHIPFLSEDEKVFLNTTATFSQVRRMSHSAEQCNSVRPSMEDNTHTHHQQRHRRNQVVSVSSLALLWKRRDSSTSTCSSSSSSSSTGHTMAAGSVASMDQNSNMTSHYIAEEEDYPEACCPKSPKARALESLIFEQPQRTVRLSLTPGCAV
ncbi:uncharacterized protein ATC70_012986 [Mucor velutinosus]|uniref:Uncharacterized protein n=1 Tax=Mucor velutinosus TaxID=708070 RepID=A0AAN7DEC5_9FUNG|nr:hypothetical protein ATC70_012986 [Mucor velutinosus]